MRLLHRLFKTPIKCLINFKIIIYKKSLFKYIKSKKKTIIQIIRRQNNKFKNFFYLIYYKLFKSKRFTFQGEEYKYFFNKKNKTWNNERAIEIPIILKFIKKYKGKNILELGNILSRYKSVNHDIVDKYDRKRNVINKDIIDYNPSKSYDLIVSISTLEHIGHDEHVGRNDQLKDPLKIIYAIENLKRILTPNGKIIFTVPIGYNSNLDQILKNDRIQFSSKYCFKRISKDNKWIQVNWENISNMRFGQPFPNSANGLLIGILNKDSLIYH